MLAISTGMLYWDLFISLIGMGFFMYGKKRPDYVALFSGIVIMVYPYFVSSLAASIGIGAGIIVLYYILKKFVGL